VLFLSHHHHDHDHEHEPIYRSQDLIVSKDIMAKAKELAELISNSEEVQQYKQAEFKIKNHDNVQEMIRTIKKKQKEIVAFKSFQNPNMVEKIENEIEQLQDELDGIPVVAEFQQTQADINQLLQLIVSVIRETVSEKINVESGTVASPSNCSE